MSTATAVAERWSPWVWKAVLVLGIGIGGLWTATHGVAGADWGQVATVLRGVTPVRLLALAAHLARRARHLLAGAVGRAARSRAYGAACCST